jgi:hypothetical protein
MNTVTYGATQKIHVGKWRSDRRGLLSGSVQVKIEEPFDKVDLKLLSVFAAPAMPIPCVAVEREYAHPHGIYTYSYEGIERDIDDERLTTFELDITTEEVGIEAHPNFPNIVAKYGPFDEKLRRFRKTMPDSEDRNPLFGTDSYMSFGVTFKKSYVRTQIPAAVLRNIGAIVKRPPGLAKFPLPAATKGRGWLKVAPKITRRGNCVHIEENFMMSGRHGIVKEIYGESQLGGTSSSVTGGLSTGGLKDVHL